MQEKMKGAIVPCEGSVVGYDCATYGQRWCMSAGRWCRNACTQSCERCNPPPQQKGE
jgi:hypothetical protein